MESKIENIYYFNYTKDIGYYNSLRNFQSSEIKYLGLALSTPKIKINASPTEYTISLYGSNIIKSHVASHLPLLNEVPKETATASPEYIMICYANETKRYFEYNAAFCEIFKLGEHNKAEVDRSTEEYISPYAIQKESNACISPVQNPVTPPFIPTKQPQSSIKDKPLTEASYTKNTFENIYKMHTKVKELIDIHYNRFTEVNLEINKKSAREFIDFNAAQLEFIYIRDEVATILQFLESHFDSNLKTRQLLYKVFIEATTNFIALLGTDIGMLAKLKAKAMGTGKYGYFEYKNDMKSRNIQSKLTHAAIIALAEENNRIIQVDKLPNELQELIYAAIHLATVIKPKYYNTPHKDIDYPAIRTELLEFYKNVSEYQCSPQFNGIKEDILDHTKSFGLLVRDQISGIEIDSDRRREIMKSLDELKEQAYEILCL